jgi:hypothetical protein
MLVLSLLSTVAQECTFSVFREGFPGKEEGEVKMLVSDIFGSGLFSSDHDHDHDHDRDRDRDYDRDRRRYRRRRYDEDDYR